MKSIYILITRTSTYFSRLIRFATADDYTHVSIAFDEQLESLYSFARKRTHFPLPGGLVNENIRRGVFGRQKYVPCELFELRVPDDVYTCARNYVHAMVSRCDEYHYSVLGILLCQFDVAHQRAYHYFCSQFVGEVLEKSGACLLPKPASLMRPADFAHLAGMRLIYRGYLCDYSPLHSSLFPAASGWPS